MKGTAARHEAEQILAELPDRISDVIEPFARHSAHHPALVQGNVTWTYAELATVVADTVSIFKLYDIRPGDRVMIVSENSLALVYPSGTTGNPKGVMLTHRNLLFSARAAGAQREPTDKVYCVLPISHIVGFSAILIASLMAGATVQLVPRFDPAALLAAIANDAITLMFCAPPTYHRLLESKVVAVIDNLPPGSLRRPPAPLPPP